MSLEWLWHGFSCDFARIQSAIVRTRPAMMAHRQMELCPFQHHQRMVRLAVTLPTTTSPSMGLCLNIFIAVLGVLSIRVSAKRARFASIFGALLVAMLTYLILMMDVTWFYVSYVLVPYVLMLFTGSEGNLVLYDSMFCDFYDSMLYDSMRCICGKLWYFSKILRFFVFFTSNRHYNNVATDY